jgi:hypothetical protein
MFEIGRAITRMRPWPTARRVMASLVACLEGVAPSQAPIGGLAVQGNLTSAGSG